jgi:RHS repeat-associated protein
VDQVGTPKVVVNADGVVVDKLDYDSYGKLVSESDPTFGLAIGFAGGLADPVTKLVRFGFRDYDPASGRFTAQDPLLFAGDSSNFYAYSGDDPVGGTDPSGLKKGAPKRKAPSAPPPPPPPRQRLEDAGKNLGKKFAKSVAKKAFKQAGDQLATGQKVNVDVDLAETLSETAIGEGNGALQSKEPEGAAVEQRTLLEDTQSSIPFVDDFANFIRDKWDRASRALSGCP